MIGVSLDVIGLKIELYMNAKICTRTDPNVLKSVKVHTLTDFFIACLLRLKSE